MKKISIVIPTRNRAHLLDYALRSALNQTYRNVEIIVCDNDSSDNTKKVVESYGNNNLIYIRTDKALSMPDNWDFALLKATGEYIAYLTDDSYLLPNTITTVMDELDKFNANVAVWKHCAYFASDWLEPARRNVLYIPKVTSTSCMINSNESLRRLFDSDENVSTIIPKSLNSLCHQSIIKNVISVQNRFFLPSCPDYSSAASVLLNAPEYLLIDQALYIDGVTSESIGATTSFNMGESTQKYIQEFDQEDNDIAFLDIPVSPAGIGKSLEKVMSYYIDTCPELNIKNLLCSISDRLVKVEVNGADVNDYWEKLNKYLSTQPAKVKFATAKQKLLSRLKWMMVRTIRSSALLEQIERVRSFHILKGSDYDFTNIEESAKVVALWKGNRGGR